MLNLVHGFGVFFFVYITWALVWLLQWELFSSKSWTIPSIYLFLSFFKLHFKNLFQQEGERARNINEENQLSASTCPLLGIEAVTQACTLTRNWTINSSFIGPHLSTELHLSGHQELFLKHGQFWSFSLSSSYPWPSALDPWDSSPKIHVNFLLAVHSFIYLI